MPSIPFDPRFLADSLTGQGFLHSPLLAWFQIERVSLNFFDDVFLLNLALETAKRVLQRLAFLKSYLSQS
jgi:hypothetical protein